MYTRMMKSVHVSVWGGVSFYFLSPGIPTSSQTTMTVTAQRRQPPVVPLTLTSDLHLQQSPQQLSPTLSSPVNITQARICCAARLQVVP